MKINLKVANLSLIKKKHRIYFGFFLLFVGLMIWSTIEEWFTADPLTNKIIAYSSIGIVHFSFIFYAKTFHILETVNVLKDGIQTEQFHTIPFTEIVSYTPFVFTKWTHTINIRLHSGQEIAFTRVKNLKNDNTVDFMAFGNIIKENSSVKN
jgi:hypothetical protein